MDTMIAVAGVAGGIAVAGLLLLARELRGRTPPEGVPRAARRAISRQTRNRALAAAVTGIAVFAVTGWPVAMVAAAAAVLFLPRIISTRTARRRVAILEGLELWTRHLSDMLAASRGLEDAIGASGRSVHAAIEPAVSNLSRRLAARTGTEAALRAFAAEIDDPAGDRIAAALIIATGRRGGAVRDVLHALAVMLAADIAARREIEADRAQHRTTVKWLTAFVLCFTAFAVLDRSYSAPYGTVTGQFVLALIGALYAGGLAWLHHLGSARVPGRFLLQPQAGGSG
jgi:Type II secretion system (T2SS), protein F